MLKDVDVDDKVFVDMCVNVDVDVERYGCVCVCGYVCGC